MVCVCVCVCELLKVYEKGGLREDIIRLHAYIL